MHGTTRMNLEDTMLCEINQSHDRYWYYCRETWLPHLREDLLSKRSMLERKVLCSSSKFSGAYM